jgi:hypothetical protein
VLSSVNVKCIETTSKREEGILASVVWRAQPLQETQYSDPWVTQKNKTKCVDFSLQVNYSDWAGCCMVRPMGPHSH